MKRAPILLVTCFWCSGLLLCWFGGWAKARYQYPPLSSVVFRGTLLCAGISFVLTLAWARRNLHLYWRCAALVFFWMSVGVSGHFYIGSNAFSTPVRALKR